MFLALKLINQDGHRRDRWCRYYIYPGCPDTFTVSRSVMFHSRCLLVLLTLIGGIESTSVGKFISSGKTGMCI